jgi:hypothetical protein
MEIGTMDDKQVVPIVIVLKPIWWEMPTYGYGYYPLSTIHYSLNSD